MESKNRNVTYLAEGYKENFVITMNNYSLNVESGEETISALKSHYYREIYEIPVPGVGYTRYFLTDTEYKANASADFKKWTFAKDADFYNCLFCLQDKQVKSEYYAEAEENPPIPSLTDSFSKYPKLPSVYLLVMQAIDIITFDAFMCMVNSELYGTDFSTKYQSVDEMAKRSIEIGAGVYSKESYYLNDRLYVRLIGETKYNKERCWVFNYSSEPSDIYMEHMSLNTSKKSKSLYSGCFYLSKKNGDIRYGELDEDIVSIGTKKKYSKRKVILERV